MLVELEYDSPEWHEFRKTHIGGSDAAVLLGISPWKTVTELYDEKMGLIQPKNLSKKSYVQYGKKAEEHIVALYSFEHPEYEVQVIKNAVFVDGFRMASLDARLVQKEGLKQAGHLEIKTGELRRTKDFEKWRDRVPDYYYAQILHYLLTDKEAKFSIIHPRLKEWFYNTETEEWEFQVVEKDYRFEATDCIEDLKILDAAEQYFAECLRKRRRPPARIPSL